MEGRSRAKALRWAQTSSEAGAEGGMRDEGGKK